MWVSMEAQTDSFFIYGDGFRYIKKDEKYEMLLIPEQHGLDYNYSADEAPLGTGCVLLLGMGLVYARLRK